MQALATFTRPPAPATPPAPKQLNKYAATLNGWELKVVFAANEAEARAVARDVLSNERKFRQLRDWEDRGSAIKLVA